MKRNLRKIGLLLVLLLPLLIGSGCTGTDVINPGNPQLEVEVAFVNNSSLRFDTARFTLLSVDIRPFPAGGNADLALGTSDLAAIEAIQVNFNNPDQPGSSRPLTPGAYRLLSLKLASLSLKDSTPPQPPFAPGITCEEFVSNYSVPAIQTLKIFDAPVVVNVTPGEGGKMRMIFDAQAFVSAVQGAFNCSSSCPGGANEPWCLSGSFISLLFTNATPSFLDIE